MFFGWVKVIYKNMYIKFNKKFNIFEIKWFIIVFMISYFLSIDIVNIYF